MQGRQVKTTYSKKRVVDGITRIPKTFVFDQNLPKEEYLKYINPENIIPESIEIATQVFSNYRKKTGSANMNRLNKVDQLTTATTQRHNRILPLMEIEKTGVNKDFTALRNESQAFEGNVTKNLDEVKQNLKKIMDKSKLNEMIQESTLDLRINGKDMTNFSLAQDTKNNTEYVHENPQLSPTKGGNGLRSIDDSFNQSKLVLQTANSPTKPRTAPLKDEILVQEQTLMTKAERVKSPQNEMKRTFQKKKEVKEDDYKISELDNTVEIVRKTDLAVRVLAKRSEAVKRDMRNFEEVVKNKIKENESAPISSIRAMNLVRDFVFNDEEFDKLLEEEEEDEEREKARKAYGQSLKKKKEKKRQNSLLHVESRVKIFQSASVGKVSCPQFMRQPVQQNEGITLTKEDKIQLAKAVQQELAQKQEELKKQEEYKLKMHKDFGIFSSEKNLFRIHSMNHIKLMKEKEKIHGKLMREMKNNKYKEREIRAQTAAVANSIRLKSIQSERPSQFFESFKTLEGDGVKEESKNNFLFQIKEVLTKPIKDNTGNKPLDFYTHKKRVDGLKKIYNAYEIEQVNTKSYYNL